jgi:crossover junction endodeoxyribonuclease RusA
MGGGEPALTIISLPWPPACLTPNAKRRKHWRSYAEPAKQYRKTCWALTLEAKARGTLLTITFCPPDNRRRDFDGMIGSFKHGIDGIADALGTDDHKFRPDIRFASPTPGGRVVCEIGGGE